MSITIPDNIDIAILLLNISNAKKLQRNQVIINNKKNINTYSHTHTDFNTHNINKQNNNNNTNNNNNNNNNTNTNTNNTNTNTNTNNTNTNTNTNNTNDDIVCTDCNTFNIKEIDGFYTCLQCGLRLDKIIDSSQEWRYYNNDDSKSADPARCDMPTNELLPTFSMGAFIGYSSKETATSKRIRNMNQWYSIPYKESTLLESFNNITNLAINAGLNQCIIEEAKYMYTKISEIKSSRRTKKEGMKAGSIALACKLKGVPRNCIEIAKICHMQNNKTLRKSIKTFEELWKNIILRNKIITHKLENNTTNNDSSNKNDNDDSGDSGDSSDSSDSSDNSESNDVVNTDSIDVKNTDNVAYVNTVK